MATANRSSFLQRLANGLEGRALEEQTDRVLIERFLIRQDDAAFEAMLRRHGPMVYRVCWRVLQQAEDAEDAFQATFLLLARNLRSVRRQESLASWLHGVARRVALKAQARAATQRRHERAKALPPTTTDGGLTWLEVQQLLDTELSRLPDKWRQPLILCYLQGQTQEEAARHLGWGKNTLRRRLDEARAALSRRLARHGVLGPATSAAILLAVGSAPAAVPSGLMGNTVTAALGVAAGRTTSCAPPRVAALMRGVHAPMGITKLKLTVLFLMGLGLLGVGGWTLALQASVDPELPTAAAPDPTPEPAPLQKKESRSEVSVKSSAPVVVKTIPEAGSTTVDASTTKEIRVTFSKDMADQSWSWSQISKESFPQTTSKPRYDDDKRTCILPVKLASGRTYVLWLNPPKFQGFRDTEGNAAIFYPLVFETKP